MSRFRVEPLRADTRLKPVPTDEGAQPTHGGRLLARLIRDGRLDGRTRPAKLLARLERELLEQPLETIRALLRGRVARKELLAQRAEAHALEHTHEFLEQGNIKWTIALWNGWRRDAEMLIHLPDPTQREQTLAEYLARQQSARQTHAATEAPSEADAPVTGKME